jgi:hypothetical protein
MIPNLGVTELAIIVVTIALFALWLAGVVKLFQKNHMALGIIALVGILIPPLGLVGYSGWFVGDRSVVE